MTSRASLGFAVAAVLLLSACAGGGAGSAGDPVLPDATLPVLGSAEQLDTADLRGTPAVINFWATWCPFCIEEMPDLEKVHQQVAGEVRFIGVDREDVTDKALRLAGETGVTYTLVEDRDGDFFRAVRALGMPTTLLVDADGSIVHTHTGPITAEQLRTLLRTHLSV